MKSCQPIDGSSKQRPETLDEDLADAADSWDEEPDPYALEDHYTLEDPY